MNKVGLILVMLLFCFYSSFWGNTLPTITSINPTSGTIGSIITINGTNFSPNKQEDSTDKIFYEILTKIIKTYDPPFYTKIAELAPPPESSTEPSEPPTPLKKSWWQKAFIVNIVLKITKMLKLIF